MSPSPAAVRRRSPSVSLAAAAAFNAAEQGRPAGETTAAPAGPPAAPAPTGSSTAADHHRRSSVAIQLADPAMPGPGEMVGSGIGNSSGSGGNGGRATPPPLPVSPASTLPGGDSAAGGSRWRSQSQSAETLHRQIEEEEELQVACPSFHPGYARHHVLTVPGM